ncbi:asparagine synthase (glutamine-hydrolyzing) [Nibribacter ruber]|uniref:asparagine synthase (glutamine-hydrolyzing) n=1 Tax=Nibribacter ruber TaxID=2698458 RepID=A0A6P1P3L9_9BACT|nr:asparagine synthase (glutamine-hydrolyzing) [Nibribacter ruber]QHL89044.1 asparagine synthase (glutamine-hydrolyzing) [Nibribacter ruber]
MCGIAGIVSVNKSNVSKGLLKSMTDAIAHRGPDGEGHWISENQFVGLGHRRLAILDLSDEGSQPMHLGSRYTIVFNGEIYNYLEIKESLLSKGYNFISNTDTEVLLTLYHEKKEACLNALDGMFSFAIFDSLENTIFCARDRFGEKPFFYALKKGNTFIFGSEMKALWAAGVERENNEGMIINYLNYGFLENPEEKEETFYKGIFRLPASSFLKITLDDFKIEKKTYWDINASVQNIEISLEEAIHKFRDLFLSSIAKRLRSDVKVGSSLSGGLDSSLVVTAINTLDEKLGIKRNTFSARFPGFHKDESTYQDLIIEKTNVAPFFVEPTKDSMNSYLDQVAYHQEEPFGSASVIAQFEVFKLAKDHQTTVLLDGQGADEILAGYHSYFRPFFMELKNANKLEYSNEFNSYKSLHQNNVINPLLEFTLRDTIYRRVSDKLHSQIKHAYSKIEKFNFLSGQNILASTRKKYTKFSVDTDFRTLNSALYYSTKSYGLEQLLRYADRNSMAHGIEVRLPFLSHELVEFVFSLSKNYKISKGWTKYLMRIAFNDLLPKEIAWRSDKIGYEPPQKNKLNVRYFEDKLVSSIEKLNKNNYITNKATRNFKDSGFNGLADLQVWRLAMIDYLLK